MVLRAGGDGSCSIWGGLVAACGGAADKRACLRAAAVVSLAVIPGVAEGHPLGSWLFCQVLVNQERSCVASCCGGATGYPFPLGVCLPLLGLADSQVAVWRGGPCLASPGTARNLGGGYIACSTAQADWLDLKARFGPGNRKGTRDHSIKEGMW
jgi:hypothetical protein